MQPNAANDNEPQQNNQPPRPAWFDELLSKYDPLLRKRCANEDVYQESICRALEQWHKFRTDGHFATWLKFIIRTINHESVIKCAREKDATVQRLVQEPVQEFVVTAKQVIGGLPTRRAETVTMIAAGYTFVEIASAHGVTPQAVEERAKRFWKGLHAANDNLNTRAA